MALSREEAERLRKLQQELALRSRLETERALARLLREYDRIQRGLNPLRQAALRAIEDGDMARAERILGQMDRALARELARLEPVERRLIERAIEQAAARGAQTVDLAPALATRPRGNLEVLLQLLEASSGGGAVGPSIGVQYGRISEAVRARIVRRVYADGLNLSERLHRRLAENRVEFNRILARGLQDGRGALQLAREIQRLDITDPKLPGYIRDLERALKGTSQQSLAEAVARAYREADKRKPGPLGLRGPARRVIQAARTGSAERLDRALQEFLDRKARYHAIVIARTEAQNAFLAGHVDRIQDVPWVRGVKWNLSASHRTNCECEVLATQDLYGMGPGIYPKDRVPERPHPNCFCYVTDVLDLDLIPRVAA